MERAGYLAIVRKNTYFSAGRESCSALTKPVFPMNSKNLFTILLHTRDFNDRIQFPGFDLKSECRRFH